MKLLLSAVIAALVLVSTASSARDFTLRPVAKTGKTVTFSWPRQPGADGYSLIRNGVPVARTMNPSTTTATFWKGSRYTVAVLHVAKGGRLTRGHSAVYAPSAGRSRRTRTEPTRVRPGAQPDVSLFASSTGRRRPSPSPGSRNPVRTATGSSATALSSRAR